MKEYGRDPNHCKINVLYRPGPRRTIDEGAGEEEAASTAPLRRTSNPG